MPPQQQLGALELRIQLLVDLWGFDEVEQSCGHAPGVGGPRWTTGFWFSLSASCWPAGWWWAMRRILTTAAAAATAAAA
jgi:hypothetical protein